MKYLDLQDIEAYRLSYHLSNKIWDLVIQWDWLSKKTIGSQHIRAMDSISANIAEGFGRYHKKDKIKFYRYSLGSLKECIDWNNKASAKNLITDEDFQGINKQLAFIKPSIYKLINSTEEKLKY